MKFAVLLFVGIFAHSALGYKLDEAHLLQRLKDALAEVEARNIMDSSEDTLTDTDSALEELLSGDFADIRDVAFKDLDEVTLEQLMQSLEDIAFKATPANMKGLVIARFATSMVDMYVYTKKAEIVDAAAAAMDEFWGSKKALRDALKFRRRYPMARKLPSEDIAGTSQEWEWENSAEFPSILSPLDAVDILMIQPMDNLMEDLKTIISPNGGDYVASVYYDLRDLVDEGIEDMTVEEFAPKVLEKLMFMVQTPGSAGDNVQDEVGARIMAYGRFAQDIDAKEEPPVKNLGDQDQLMLVWQRVKPFTKDISHVVRNIAKYTEKDKTDNLVLTLGNFAASVLSGKVSSLRD